MAALTDALILLDGFARAAASARASALKATLASPEAALRQRFLDRDGGFGIPGFGGGGSGGGGGGFAANGTAAAVLLEELFDQYAVTVRGLSAQAAALLPWLVPRDDQSPTARALSEAVEAQLAALASNYRAGSIVFYNSPAAAVGPIPADFRFRLPVGNADFDDVATALAAAAGRSGEAGRSDGAGGDRRRRGGDSDAPFRGDDGGGDDGGGGRRKTDERQRHFGRWLQLNRVADLLRRTMAAVLEVAAGESESRRVASGKRDAFGGGDADRMQRRRRSSAQRRRHRWRRMVTLSCLARRGAGALPRLPPLPPALSPAVLARQRCGSTHGAPAAENGGAGLPPSDGGDSPLQSGRRAALRRGLTAMLAEVKHMRAELKELLPAPLSNVAAKASCSGRPSAAATGTGTAEAAVGVAAAAVVVADATSPPSPDTARLRLVARLLALVWRAAETVPEGVSMLQDDNIGNGSGNGGTGATDQAEGSLHVGSGVSFTAGKAGFNALGDSGVGSSGESKTMGSTTNAASMTAMAERQRIGQKELQTGGAGGGAAAAEAQWRAVLSVLKAAVATGRHSRVNHALLLHSCLLLALAPYNLKLVEPPLPWGDGWGTRPSAALSAASAGATAAAGGSLSMRLGVDAGGDGERAAYELLFRKALGLGAEEGLEVHRLRIDGGFVACSWRPAFTEIVKAEMNGEVGLLYLRCDGIVCLRLFVLFRVMCFFFFS
ncbi:unnamed protein product [Phaeothamnion confervicola]